MIIVEGADNVGKSTFVTGLIESDPSLRILHRDRFKPKMAETIATSYLKALIPTDGDRVAHARGVADRFFASECIYGELFRDGCRMTEGEHWAVLMMLQAYAPLIVHCDASDQSIKDSWAKREQLYDDPLIIAKAYRKRIKGIFKPLQTYGYSWESDPRREQMRFISKVHRQRLDAHERKLSWWSVLPYGMGSLDENGALLVGEAPSPQAVVPVPFSAGPAGCFLSKAVVEVNGMLRDLALKDTFYVTNAQKGTERDAVYLREEIRFLKPTRVVALGKIAHDMLDALNVKHVEIPHPMYWKRFRKDEWNEYPKLLHRALTSY